MKLKFFNKKQFEDAINNCIKLIRGETTSPITIHSSKDKDFRFNFVNRREIEEEFKNRASLRISNEDVPNIETNVRPLTDDEVSIMYELMMVLCEIGQTDNITFDFICHVDKNIDFYFENFFSLSNDFNPAM